MDIWRINGLMLACLVFATQKTCIYCVQAVTSRISSEIPCNGLRGDVLVRHRNVFACSGTWKGHIASTETNICNKGWHTCSWNDTEILAQISWYDVTHISGCYAVNAAHNGITCNSCLEGNENGEMAAVGADCIKYDFTSHSCFGQGRIDASMHQIKNFTACHHAPWISGVLCCEDELKGSAPTMTSIMEPYLNVIPGAEVSVICKAKGDPNPEYEWYKNGELLVSSSKYSIIDGTLTISSASDQDEGFYHCKAKNRFGFAVSYKTQLQVRKIMKGMEVKGCKNPKNGKALYSEDMAFCKGRWHGHIKRAAKQLCANGWAVCSVEDMRLLYTVTWNDVISEIPGCYAYNAASSKYFPCSKCTPKRDGNRMSGIGRGCGNVEDSGYSCLKQGRIDVRHEEQSINGTTTRQRKRLLRSCHYFEDITTGAVCCQKQRTKKRMRERSEEVQSSVTCQCKNGGSCTGRRKCRCRAGFAGRLCQHRRRRNTCSNSQMCGKNSVCSTKGRCICQKGYKRQNGNCHPNLATTSCANKCLNRGVCKNGKCDCPAHTSGEQCEKL